MSKFATQSIIVKKGFTVHNLKQAESVARRYGTVTTSRKTGSSWRFRQESPKKFIQSSFRTKRITKQVSLVVGRKK